MKKALAFLLALIITASIFDCQAFAVAIDKAPPVMVHTSPMNSAKLVSVGTKITVTFNEPIFKGTDLGKIYLKSDANASITIQTSLSGKTLSIAPKTTLKYNTSYTLTIPKKAIKDKAGNLQGKQIIIRFCTENVPTEESNINSKEFAYHPLSTDYAYDVIKEITGDKYTGRLSGTKGYADAANYVAGQFKALKLSPAGDKGTYLQEYPVCVAQFGGLPTLTVNGRSLKFMKDFKVHGNSGSGTIDNSEIAYVGYGYPEDYTVDVTGKTVLFLGDLKNNQPSGVMDRAAFAKSKGAKGVLIVPNRFNPMASYEKPLNASSVGLPTFYVSRDVVNTLPVDVDSPQTKVVNASVSGSVTVNRSGSQPSYNVVGMVEGRDKTKSVVISANLDGCGQTPGGVTYQCASMDAAGVGELLSLAKYYSENAKPYYNTIFAVFGSRFQENQGSSAFVNSVKSKNILANFSLFDVGGELLGDGLTCIVSDKYQTLSRTVKANSDRVLKMEDEMPNGGVQAMDFFQFEKQKIATVMVRSSQTGELGAGDNLGAIKKGTITKTLTRMNEMVLQFVAESISVPYNPKNVKTEMVKEVGRNWNVYEGEHFKLYYEDYASKVIPSLVPKLERVYEETLWWNFYPVMKEKVKFFLCNNHEDGWKVTHRLDKKNGDPNEGGMQSLDSLCLASIDPKGTFSGIEGGIAHEFNHVAANAKLAELGKAVTPVAVSQQEISGHVYAYSAFREFGDMMAEFSKSLGNGFFQNIKPEEEQWKEYSDGYVAHLNPSTYYLYYDKLASFEYFIWKNYGREACREFQYDFYLDNNTSVAKSIQAKTGVDIKTLNQQWKSWCSASGASNKNMSSNGLKLGFSKPLYVMGSRVRVIFDRAMSNPSNVTGIRIVDPDGKEIPVSRGEANSNDTFIDFFPAQGLSSGTYTVKIPPNTVSSKDGLVFDGELELTFIVP